MLQEGTMAAADATVGKNLVDGEYYEELGFPRNLVAIALKGSAAAGDTEVSIAIGTDRKCTVFNSGTGFPNLDDFKPVGPIYIPAGMPLRLEVTDAPVTNPINWTLVFG